MHGKFFSDQNGDDIMYTFDLGSTTKTLQNILYTPKFTTIYSNNLICQAKSTFLCLLSYWTYIIYNIFRFDFIADISCRRLVNLRPRRLEVENIFLDQLTT